MGTETIQPVSNGRPGLFGLNRDQRRKFVTWENRDKRRVGRTKPTLAARTEARRVAGRRAKQARKVNR